MFLDPEPKRQKHSMPPQRHAPPKLPVEQPDDQRWRIKRRPLKERSQSEGNRQTPEPVQPTVRLVKPSPSPSAVPALSKSLFSLPDTTATDFDDIQTAKIVTVQKYDRASSRLSTPGVVVEGASAAESGLPGFLAKSGSERVSGSYKPTNEAQNLEVSPSITLRPKTSTHVGPQTAWHRRSGSSGDYSNSSTLHGADNSIFLHSSRSERFSVGTTLRGTPTPTEQEIRSRTQADERESARQGPAHALQTLQEASPERTTVRAVPQSVESSPTEDRLGSGPSDSSLPHSTSACSPPSECEQPPEIPRKSSRRRTLSAASVPSPLHIRKTSSSSPVPREQQSQDSLAQSDLAFPEPSSPIVVIYDSDSTRPRSRSQPLRFTPSVESIQSRLQYPTVIRPQTGRSLANSSSWASLNPTSSTDTLPPLHVPKKRLRRQPASLSLGSASNFASGGRMASDEDVDMDPYPRRPFSNVLSTIASESDRQSRAASQQLSHFSLGSGVLTGDDSASIPLSETWERLRRGSAPIESMVSDSSHHPPSSSNASGAGDISVTMYREESAKPQPLFKPRSPSAPGERRRYDGPLPPLPPIPKSRDSDENFDTVSELPPQSPALRPKRSGYSLRQRSNSTPSRSNSHSRHVSQVSYIDSDRGSHASSIFPTWAKHFYGGTAHLLSASKVSLSSNNTPQRQGRPVHGRNDSQWTERSITSRLGTGYSEIENGSSPTSSHFLPSIFRPRTRPLNGNSQSSRLHRSKRGRPSGDGENRPDSLAIFSNPLPPGPNGTETLPSGQPKWGTLKDEPGESSQMAQHRPLPRKYSKQKQWDQMEFPRPMTKDRLSDFGIHDPHLAPSRRSSNNRLSMWQAPSFVESLDSLIRSRCNRQILLFTLGFVFPLMWMLGAILPLPKKPVSKEDFEKSVAGSEEDVAAAMMKHEAGDAERRWREEKQWMKARWWRTLNRIMSVIGVLVIGAVVCGRFALDCWLQSEMLTRLQIALAVVATRR